MRFAEYANGFILFIFFRENNNLSFQAYVVYRDYM